MAGHSKFKNIMHRKGAQDKKRAKLFSRLIREISVAAKLAGNDPESNPRLRTAINNALSANMSKDNIDRAIKKNTSDSNDEQIQEILYEGFGPNGVAIIIECLTDNKNRSASEIRSTFSKHNGNLGVSGCVKHNFEKVGVISYPKNIDDFDSFFNYCASIDADDILESESSFDVYTSIDSFNQIILKLEEKYKLANFTTMEWKPLNTIDVDGEDSARGLMKLLEKLEDLDDVQNVSANFNISDSLMEKVLGE